MTLASNHYGLMKTIQSSNDYSHRLEEGRRYLSVLTGDESWTSVRVQLHPSVLLFADTYIDTISGAYGSFHQANQGYHLIRLT